MRAKLLAVLLCGVLWTGNSPVWAQAKPALEQMRFIYSAVGGSQSSIWIPHEAGIFRKHGLDIELLYVGGGGRAAQVVQSGEAPMGVFTGGAVVNADLAGGDLVVVASTMNVITFFWSPVRRSSGWKISKERR
jgi:NitT/TauT family transport system substrate-binding protein